MGPGGGGADGSRPRSTSTGRREVADGRPRHAGMGIVLRRSWGHVWRVKERRWQVDAAAPGSEPATGCRDWGRESELDDGIGDGRGPSWAVLVVRACGVGVWARVGAVLGGAAS